MGPSVWTDSIDLCVASLSYPPGAIPVHRSFVIALLTLLPSVGSMTVSAADGPFGIDHRIAYDNSGIWKRSYQIDLANGAAIFVIGDALWDGGESKFGDTLWCSLDAMILTAGTTTVAKFTFSRERPSQTSDPNQFFTGRGNQSFPSGEVAEIASVVTPFIVEYGPENPAAYSLALLPVYDAIARVKVRGHWQSDALVGGAIGVGFGYYTAHRDRPIILSALPGGFMVGLHKEF
jgi:hypothetical protein